MRYWAIIFSVVSISFFGMNTLAIASTGTSDATVEFIEGSGTTEPVDPENPSIPLDPTDSENPTDPPTGNVGPLSLDYVSSINFGINDISVNREIYESTSLKPFIQVTDRRGTGAGWVVTAQASEFTANGEPTLQGSVINFTNGEVLSISTSSAPNPISNISLHTGGDAAQVVFAPVNTGLGTWINRWFPSADSATNDNVTLEVPAGAATIGNHSAVITWTLTDAPGQ